MTPIIRHGYSTRPRRTGSTRAYRDNRAMVLANATHCSICGGPPTFTDPFVADHVIPYAYGGTDHPSNLRPTHKSCNLKRGAG